MNKKITSALALGMAGAMVLGLTACGDKDVDNDPVESNPPVVEDDANKENTDNTQTPDVEIKDDENKVEVSLTNIVDTLKNTYGANYLPSTELDQDTFNMMVGLESDMYSEFYAAMPMIGTHADKLFVVKTDKVDEVKAVFDAYQQSLMDDLMQYPMNIAKVNNSSVYVAEDYVMFYILGGYTDEEPADIENKTPEEAEAELEAIQTAYYVEQMNIGKAALDKLFVDGIVPDAPVIETEDVEVDVTDETEEANTEDVQDEVSEDAVVTEDTTTTENDETVVDDETTEPVDATEVTETAVDNE